MTIAQILDSIYIIPVILDHMTNPTPLTKKILNQNDIFEKDIEDLRPIKSLLYYHREVLGDKFQPSEERYVLLRKGLNEYYQYFLSVLIEYQFEFESDKICSVLDYGAGDGHVAEHIRAMQPNWVVTTMDKTFLHGDHHIHIDFEKDSDWWKLHIHQYDYIILSEVLHCKDSYGQQRIISECHSMLKSKGELIIIENVDYCMAYRIQKIKKDAALHILDEDHVRELCQGAFLLNNIQVINKHKMYVYAKV